jgi:hypothetical protein
MSNSSNPLEQVLNTAPLVDSAERDQHITQFVYSFVVKNRRDRWLYLLLNPTTATGRNSHKLYGDLDREYCTIVHNATIPSQVNPNRVGIFDTLHGEPRKITLGQIWKFDLYNDNLYLIRPGSLALFFFHESELFVCERSD